jgi:hypothetical protein
MKFTDKRLHIYITNILEKFSVIFLIQNYSYNIIIIRTYTKKVTDDIEDNIKEIGG